MSYHEDDDDDLGASWSLPKTETVAGWQREIYRWAETKGWNQDLKERSFGDWIALMHTEISEAYEDYRDHHGVTEIYYEFGGGGDQTKYSHEEINEWRIRVGEEYATTNLPKPCGIPIEIADLAIRMLHFCEHFGIDLNEMIALKMKYNETRPHRHGNKKV